MSNQYEQQVNLDSDSEDDEVSEELIELGFVSKIQNSCNPILHESMDWSEWDGGKIGGQPIWINPNTIPTSKELTCENCSNPMLFLLQIYCPLDDVESAFHRCIYVFCCKNGECLLENRIKVFRNQLARMNDIYPYESGVKDLRKTNPDHKACALCGNRALYSCSSCRIAFYCCQEHQKDHWKNGHKNDCDECSKRRSLVISQQFRDTMIRQGSKYTFPVHEITIEHEPNINEAMNDHEQSMIDQFKSATINPRDPDSSDPFTDDSPIDLTQKEITQILGSASIQDPQYVKFVARTALAKDQVLRYTRWGEGNPLWVHSKDQATSSDIPKCEHCNTPREFEFQIMPQLLYYIGIDRDSSLQEMENQAFDWGTIVVYTCPQSCEVGDKYVTEFAWRQSPYNDLPNC